MGKSVLPPSGGTMRREPRIQSEADAFARLAHDLHEQPNLEKTLERIVESAAAVVGCDYAGVLVTRKATSSTRSPQATRSPRKPTNCRSSAMRAPQFPRSLTRAQPL
jgi:hypothetical protein